MAQKRRYNNYTLAIIASLSITVLVVSLWYLLGASLIEGLISQGMYDFLAGSVMVMLAAQAAAGSGYVATSIDIATDERTITESCAESPLEPPADPKQKLNFLRRSELIGLLLGLGLAILLTILLFIKKAGSFVFHKLPVIGPVLFLVANMGMLAGFFGRIGRVVDYFRMKAEKNPIFDTNANYTLAVIAGTVIGLILSSVILGVAGVTSVMTFGGAIPAWAGGISAVLAITGATVSASSYFGRMFDFLIGLRTILEPTKKDDTTIGKRANAERVLTVIGIGVGIILATALVLSGIAVTSGLFGLGLPLWASTPVIYATVIAFCAGTANRIGFAISRYQAAGAPVPVAVDEVGGAEKESLLPTTVAPAPQPLHDGQHMTGVKAPEKAKELKDVSAAELGNSLSTVLSSAPGSSSVNADQPKSAPRFCCVQ